MILSNCQKDLIAAVWLVIKIEFLKLVLLILWDGLFVFRIFWDILSLLADLTNSYNNFIITWWVLILRKKGQIRPEEFHIYYEFL
jgi:hypothetical protein